MVASCQELIIASSAGDGNFSSTSVWWGDSISIRPPSNEGAKGIGLAPAGELTLPGNGGSSLSTLRYMTTKTQMRMVKI
jgi:hypothetical protein